MLRPRPNSLRLKLAAGFALTITVILLLYAGLTYVALGQILSTQLSDKLEADAEASLAAALAGTVAFFPHDASPDPDTPPLRWAEVRGPDGGVLLRHFPANLDVDLPDPVGEPVPTGPSPSARPVSDKSSLLFDYSPPERPGLVLRVLMTRRPAPDGALLTVTTARSLEPMQRELRDFVRTSAAILPFGVLLAGFAGYVAAGRALRPVSSMAERAERITASNLSDRLPVDDPGNELGHLATVFNQTFARLEGSFERLRRFTADASHELRTPLTVLRSVGEAGLRDAASADDLRDTVGSMLEEADKMTGLVDSLLLLARADSGEVALERAPAELLDLAEETARCLDILAEENGQRIEVSGDAGAVVMADRGVVGQAVMNLVHNALRYAPEGSAVRLTVRRGARFHSLAVADEGPGIPLADQPHIFDRFYRVRQDRSRAHGGTGLGLAIARWAATIHGGDITLESEPGKGARFTLHLPALAEGTDAPDAAGALSGSGGLAEGTGGGVARGVVENAGPRD
ncbi:integral membrane sensor signal transduction histidine kinase [Desulfovibrio sp. X2]|uniref:sensor histidine kinase n=1 Tax=Desulfovibrio sp. X2 TaxID=941449 RepID=UPI000358B4AD|nr:ATP-binding protein [Desulfovibrio sp. X2]EPR36320.1 integral membrane sensor signal transduction histidine kinase [Desulfovibrio sp. X2]